MVVAHKNRQISTLEDIQTLKVKDLREILRSNSEVTCGIKADLVLKVYAILMRHVHVHVRVRISSKVAIILLSITRIQRKIVLTSSTMKL